MSGFRALRIHQEHGATRAALRELTLADLTPGEVVIEARYSGVNYKDALAATGRGRFCAARRWSGASTWLAWWPSRAIPASVKATACW